MGVRGVKWGMSRGEAIESFRGQAPVVGDMLDSGAGHLECASAPVGYFPASALLHFSNDGTLDSVRFLLDGPDNSELGAARIARILYEIAGNLTVIYGPPNPLGNAPPPDDSAHLNAAVVEIEDYASKGGQGHLRWLWQTQETNISLDYLAGVFEELGIIVFYEAAQKPNGIRFPGFSNTMLESL